MAMFGFIEILFVVLSGGGGNELLDFLPTDAYWQSKGVAISVQAMAGELSVVRPAGIPQLIRDLGADAFGTREAATKKLRAMGTAARKALLEAAKSDDPEVSERAKGLLARLVSAGTKAKAIRRLMAIRALGELKKPEALPALQPLLKSDELFVADYAARAIAAIEGRAWKPAALAKATLEADLRLLPPNCGLVAQAAMLGNPQFSISKAIADLGGMLPGGMDPTQILGKLTEGILMVAERVGNVRIERITLGVADNVGDDAGFVVIVVRGAYDAAAASAALQQIGLNATKVDGMDVLAADREFRFIPCSNRRLVMIGGPRQAVMPVEDVIAAIKTPPDALRLNEELAALVRKADVTQPLWAVATLTDAYRQTPVTAPFDTATLTSTTDEKGDLAGTLVAVGKDAEAVKRVADLVNNVIKEGITELTKQAGRMPAMKPMLDILKSVQVKQTDATLTITGKLKGSFILPMMPMFMMSRAVGHKAAVEAVPPQVMEEAVPAPR